MKDAICLRCDWTGEERGSACPSCGAWLFRPTAQVIPKKKRTRKRSPPNEGVRHDVREEREGTSTKWTSRWAGGLVVLVLLMLAVAFVVRSTPDEKVAPAARPGLRGALVYATQESFGWSRLHVMDLETGLVVAGPQVFRPKRLVEVANQTRDRIGAVVTFEGVARAGWVDLSSSARYPTEPLASGRYVEWSPSGTEVFSATRRVRGSCEPVGIRRIQMAGPVRRFTSARVCGTLEGLSVDGRSNAFITVHQPSRGGWAIWHVSRKQGGFTRVVLSGYRLLSASPDGHMAVASRRQAFERSGSERALEFFALGDDHPKKVGTPTSRLQPERVLGWTKTGDAAYVLGSLNGVRGVFIVPVRSSEEHLLPRLILETPEEVGMAQTPDGIALLSAGGQFLVYQDGSLSSLDIPDETPRPVGPMLWLPALPYSEG